LDNITIFMISLLLDNLPCLRYRGKLLLLLAQAFQGVPEEDKRKIVQENTSKLYGFALSLAA